MIINQKILETDITNIINAFERLMDESNRSIIPVKSRHVDGLSLFENMYIRARSKHASLLGKPVLVVSSVSVFITNQGCFSTLLSHLKAHCKNKSYLLKIESVISLELRRYLVRQMFVFIGEEWECGSGYWVPEDDPVYPSLNTLPY
ncbi:TPA: hypothetical protein IF275_000782 [Escherichia coli]|nr:hypothetical protein [Escherichia coli]